MLLESLELDNFKSFGNKKKISFRKGFTVISGPNGSGKSNIGDSLLFVLGTRSSKTVRADRLADLIHTPSNERKKRNYCSVTVTLDNTDSAESSEDRHIVLKRELVADVDGYKSNYYINGKRVRHTDVSNLLDSLRIYLDSYSFVLQGDINNIVKMTGTERRKLLESISGIETFDVQIEKAKGDIAAINENLTRLEVLTEQTRLRKDQLENEKAGAEKYLELVGHNADLKKTYHSLEIEAINREMRSYSGSANNLQQQISSTESKISELEMNLEAKRRNEEELKMKLEVSGNSQLNEIRTQVENKRIKIAELGINIENTKDRIARIKSETAENSEDIKKSEKKIQWLQSNKEENSQTLMDIRTEIQGKVNDLRILKDKSSKSNSEILQKQEEIREKDQEIKTLNSQLLEIQREKEALNSQRTQTISELGRLEEKKKDLEFQVRDANWRLKEIEKEVGGSKKNYETLNFKYYELKNELDKLRGRKDELQVEMNRIGREHGQLQAMSASRSGSQNRAVTTIMNARNQGRISGIHGTIKELIKFNEEFRAAIEAAAGSRLNSVVVEDDGVAEKCLEILKQEKTGKLTFLPINKVLGGRPRGKAITVRGSEGSLGYVFEKVSYESRYEGIVWYAFQDTVIVKDVKTARKYMVGARLVTTDGDIFEANGAITGGYQDRSRSSADTEQKIIQLSAKIREISAELEEINSVIPTVESQFETVSQQLREGSRDEGARNSEMQQLKKISTEGRPQIENIQVTITEMSDKLKELDNEIRKLEEKYGQITQHISAVESDKNGLFDKIKELSPKYAEKEERLDDEIASLRSKESEFSSEITKIDLDISHLRDRVSESTEKISNMAQESAELTKQLRNTQDNLLIENDELAKLRAVEADISQRSKEIVNALNEVGSEIRRIQDSLDTERANLSTGRGMLLSIELKIEGLEAKSREITSEMSAIDGKILTDMRSLTEIKREMEDCNREISQLGPVNQKAIEEYAEVSKDLDDLIREVEGLSSEKLELEMLTEKLNEQKKHVLLDMYNAINENMKLIYHEISGGGEAYLEMSDVNNPLESEMHIKAKPKGTNFSKIEALSGGEKSLTALSFILAVQRINPSPVYYLDEVDMFLDGANAERVGKMFRANSDNSQVLAVSLRKAMLKYADNVVGVTSFDDENTEVFEKSVESEMGVVK